MKWLSPVTSQSVSFDGRIEEEGSPDQIFNHPQKERTKEFLSRFTKTLKD